MKFNLLFCLFVLLGLGKSQKKKRMGKFKDYLRLGPNRLLSPDSPMGYETECGLRAGWYNSLMDVNGQGNQDVPGRLAEPHEFPWVVSIQMKLGPYTHHICTGAILSPFYVITALHCVYGSNYNFISVLYGTNSNLARKSDGGIVPVQRIIPFSEVDQYKMVFDVDLAMLEVAEMRLDGSLAAPICLPPQGHNFEYSAATVNSWELITSADYDKLQYITTKFTEPQKSMGIIQNLLPLMAKGMNSKCMHFAWYQHFTGSQSCPNKLDLGGAPVVCRNDKDRRYYLCGLAVWNCGFLGGNSFLPATFTQISCYSDKIVSTLYNGLPPGFPSSSK